MDSWPQETERHYLRYRKSGSNWLIAGPWLCRRASISAAALAPSAQGPASIDADERIILPADADVKATDTIVCVETNNSSLVQSSAIEPGFVEALLKRQKVATSLPGLYA